jgi:hypothetical protein
MEIVVIPTIDAISKNEPIYTSNFSIFSNSFDFLNAFVIVSDILSVILISDIINRYNHLFNILFFINFFKIDKNIYLYL